MSYALKLNKGVNMMTQNGPTVNDGLLLTASIPPTVITLTDTSQAPTIFTGYAEDLTSLTSQPKWRISRTSSVGFVTTTTWADSGNYSQIWDNRTSLFPATPFNNTYSMAFDGIDDNIVYPSLASFQFQRLDSFSISLWMKATATGQAMIIGYKQTTTNTPGWEIIKLNGTTLSFYFRGTSNANSMNLSYTLPTLSNGLWHHVAVVSNGGTSATTQFYFDNVLIPPIITTDAFTTVVNYSTAIMSLGGRYNIADMYAGKVDELAIYNIALNASQISAIYGTGHATNQNILPTFTNLLLWHRFEAPANFPVIPNSSSIGPTDVATMVNMLVTAFNTDVP